MELEIILICDCGDPLETELEPEMGYPHTPKIIVKPCETCLGKEWDRGYEMGQEK